MVPGYLIHRGCLTDHATKNWHVGTAGVFKGSKAETTEGGGPKPFIVYGKGYAQEGKVIRQAISTWMCCLLSPNGLRIITEEIH
jgi:arylsulfatase A-like enzyme